MPGRAMPEGASDKSDRAVVNGAASVSALRASVPSAPTLIVKPFKVGGHCVTSRMIADAIDLLANLPDGIHSRQLFSAIFPAGEPFRYARDEALNRLFQRWRKLDLIAFQRGRWWLKRGAWEKMQAQAIEARRAETQGGSVHESAVRQDAPEQGSKATGVHPHE